ncbi:vesicle transport protein GOT1B [Trichonephila inaurata madagascariensis]|uniref:Vesicle transport protein GOT1B n=1 Tax=Trichonephila inaurata madagascariensis TaxID=2747483 RepID=A0A8X6YPM2_9ARAC|nr:vesicle transport protein GOT1B [Trichonephila inaurata madagascariensis]
MFEITDYQKIGIGLTGFGLFFLFLGVVFLFDKGLLALGNILFLSGLAFLFGGILIVLFGWPLVGMLIEIYGFIVLFSGFLPIVVNFLRRVPVLGTILNFPILNKISSA